MKSYCHTVGMCLKFIEIANTIKRKCRPCIECVNHVINTETF